MLRTLGCCAVLAMTAQALGQERIIKGSNLAKDTATLGQFFEKTLPSIVTKEGSRRCEFFQYPVECVDIGISAAKLLAATKKADQSSLPKALVFLDIKTDGPKKKPFVRFPLVGSPVPPAIPFVAYDGEKNRYFTAFDKAEEVEKAGQDFAETDPYLHKVLRLGDAPQATAFDPAFDKGMTIADALNRQKKEGFKFVETSFDEGLDFTFPGLRRVSGVAASDVALEYWQEFYNRSSKRDLSWGDDCTDCAIVRKTQLAPNYSFLEYCKVQVAAGRRGAPENCVLVVMFRPDGIWMRAAVTFEYPHGFGGGDSGYELDCTPVKKGKDPLVWGGISDDISKTIAALDYVPVKSRHGDEQKFVNEFGKSKLYPEKNYEWTTVTTGPIPADKDTISGFYLTLNVNFSLLPEVDQSRYRPARVPEETDGLRRLSAIFKDRYGCTVIHH